MTISIIRSKKRSQNAISTEKDNLRPEKGNVPPEKTLLINKLGALSFEAEEENGLVLEIGHRLGRAWLEPACVGSVRSAGCMGSGLILPPNSGLISNSTLIMLLIWDNLNFWVRSGFLTWNGMV